MPRLALVSVVLFVTSTALAQPGQPAGAPTESKPAEAPDQAALEKEFAEKLTNAVMVGHYVGGNNEVKDNAYHIVKVTKQEGDRWLFISRIQYGGKDFPVPMVIPVKWAGDTAVISVTDMPVPGSGVYTARVLVYRDHFSGFWSGGTHAGHLWGEIEKEKPQAKGDAPAGKKSN